MSQPTTTRPTTPPAAGTPPILMAAGPLLSCYDVVFCDVWGVVHDGHTAYSAACHALSRFRAQGGTVVLVSNAPVPNDAVAAMLDSRRVPRAAYDAIVSSGDIALAHVAERGYERGYLIGPADRDSKLFDRLPLRATPLAQADAIICSGLTHDDRETEENYRTLLIEARERDLPFVCANPDLVVDVGGRLYLCAGAIAAVYETLGGDVFWAGKPYAAAYDTARAHAERLRDRPVDRARILGIGDALRTDLAGAANAGIDGLFIGAGIHRHDSMTGDALDPAKLDRLFAPGSPPAVGAMAVLEW